MQQGLSPEQKEDICVVSGFAHPELAVNVAHAMAVPLDPIEQKTFPNGEYYVRYEESVRGRHVFIIQPHVGGDGFSINDSLAEQALLVEAARDSSAGEVTAVIPFLGYSRQDRKSRGREPISVKLPLGLMSMMGAHRIVSVDMHSPQTQLGFNGQFDHLTAQPLLLDSVRDEIAKHELEKCVVVSPDAGATALAQSHQEALGVDLVHLAKRRKRGQSHAITREERVPEVAGRACIIFDDMIDTAGTICTAAEVLKKSGAANVIVASTHGIFSGPAFERLRNSPIDRILVTDTVPMKQAKEALGDQLKVVSVAPTLGRALIEIATNGSVSRIFKDQNHM